MPKVVHYVEFWYPGIIVAENSVREVDSRLPQDLKKIPVEAYAFRFFDKIEDDVSGRKLASAPENYSGYYFLGGEKKTVDQILIEEPDSILAENMKKNKIGAIVKTKFGQHMIFGKNDCII
jgi:hypothetical protein